MKRCFLLLALVPLVGLPAGASAAPRETTLEDAIDILGDLAAAPEKRIPPAMLRDAAAVVIAPDVVKAGFIVAGPDLSRVSVGVPGGIGGGVNSPTRPELLIVPPSLVMNSDTGLPLFKKLIDSV